MAIKYLNNNVNTINFEDHDVKKVILDSDIVWCKPFTYTIGTLPTGVASLTCTRYSNDEPSASTGTIANGGTIYYGDTLYWSATAAPGYNNPTVTYDGSTAGKRYTVVGNVNGVTTSGVQAGSIKTYTITLASTYGHWENASGTTITSIANVAYGTATSKSSNKLTVGSNVYTFVVDSDTAQYHYDFSSISGNPATVTSNVTITGTATQTIRTYNISWTYKTEYNTIVTVGTTYKYGDIPGTTAPQSGTVPTPEDQYESGNHRRYVYLGWDDLSQVTSNRRIEAQYEHEMKLTITETDCDSVTLDGVPISCPYEDWINIDDTSSLPTIEWTALTYTDYKKSFSNGSLTLPLQTYSEDVVTSKYSYDAMPNYYYDKVSLTVNTNSTAKVSSTTTGGTSLTTGTYYILENSYINLTTNTPPSNTRYSFSNTSSDVTSKSDKITDSKTVNYPIYTWYYVQINATNSTAHKGTATGTTITSGSSAWYISGQTITWTPSTYYSFSAGTSQINTQATISSASALSKSPTNYKAAAINNNSYSTANKNNTTYYASGTNITWTAGTNYSFGGTTAGDTTTSGPITAGGTFNAPNPGYVKCAISGTNCSANKTSGTILAVGTTITWTGTSGTNYKYGFGSGATWSDSYSTTTQDVALGTISYSKTASYTYYKVTINASSTGPTNYQSLFASSSSSATSGTAVSTGTQWILKNYYLRAQALASDTYNIYNFDNSPGSAESGDKWKTSSKITSSTTWNIPTMYKWIKITNYSNPTHGHAEPVNWRSWLNTWVVCSSWSNVDGWSYPVDLRGSYYLTYQAVFDSYTGSTTKTEYVKTGGAITFTSIAKWKANVTVSAYDGEKTQYQIYTQFGDSYRSQARTEVQYATNTAQTSWAAYNRFTDMSGSSTGNYVYWPNYTNGSVPKWTESSLKYIRCRTTLLVSASASDLWAQPSGVYSYFTLDPDSSQM